MISEGAPRRGGAAGRGPAKHTLTWLDVFSSTPLAGNGLVVVHDADDLDDATMLAFARETKLSETTFVQSGDDDCDYRNRIWMLTGELPMAGHPSLGTAVAVAHRRGETSVTYVQRTPSGCQPVSVELDGRLARSSMLQEPWGFLGVLDPAEVTAALGLTPDDLHPDLRPELVTTGGRQVLVPLADVAALARATPHPARVEGLLSRAEAITVYAFVARGSAAVDARAFFASPGGLAEEDPATGSAAGTLMAYLHRHAGLDALTIAQGEQMGRPSRLECFVERGRVRVAGEVVVLAEGVLHL